MLLHMKVLIHLVMIYSQPTPQEDTERMDIIGQNGNDGLHYDVEPRCRTTIGNIDEPIEEIRPLKGEVKIKYDDF